MYETGAWRLNGIFLNYIVRFWLTLHNTAWVIWGRIEIDPCATGVGYSAQNIFSMAISHSVLPDGFLIEAAMKQPQFRFTTGLLLPSWPFSPMHLFFPYFSIGRPSPGL